MLVCLTCNKTHDLLFLSTLTHSLLFITLILFMVNVSEADLLIRDHDKKISQKYLIYPYSWYYWDCIVKQIFLFNFLACEPLLNWKYLLFLVFPCWCAFLTYFLPRGSLFFNIPDILHILSILSPNRETVLFHIWTGMLMSSITSIWYHCTFYRLFTKHI